jgi:thymidylate synthase (FAD)
MELINPSVEMINERDIYKRIELAGRTCYKSEDKIKEDSAKKFVKAMIKSNHTAMLEHASLVFQVDSYFIWDTIKRFNRRYLNMTECLYPNRSSQTNRRLLVSGNIRAINESKNRFLLKAMVDAGYEDAVYSYDKIELDKDYNADIKVVDIMSIENIQSEEILNHYYPSFRCITDRAVTHEMVRHRPASFAQESQRYVNYEKKGGVEFIKPYWFDSASASEKISFKFSLQNSEGIYKELIESGLKPQEARGVLPNATKTEIVMTAPMYEWQHFLNLRYFGTTGTPHPDIKNIASYIHNYLKEDELVSKHVEIVI